MSEQKYLLKFYSDWADQMDIEGHCVMDIEGHCVLNREEYREFTNYVNEASNGDEFVMMIGTNQYIECNWSEIKHNYSVTELTDEQYKVLKELNLCELGFARKFYEYVADM